MQKIEVKIDDKATTLRPHYSNGHWIEYITEDNMTSFSFDLNHTLDFLQYKKVRTSGKVLEFGRIKTY